LLVVDTSALLAAQFQSDVGGRVSERLAVGGELGAPHSVDLEFLQALRRLLRQGFVSEDRAADACVQFAELSLTRYPHEALADRIWELRHNLTAYDAAFVALAEALGVPLVTCDAAIAKAPATRAAIELFATVDD